MASMTRTPKTPAYMLHKGTGQSRVQLNGQDFYLGAWRSPESIEKYDRLIAEWLANGRRPPRRNNGVICIAEVIVRYMDYAQTRYPRRGKNWEGYAFEYASQPLLKCYGRLAAADFGPLQLRAVRMEMAKLGWCRKTVNRQVKRVIHMMKWAVANGLIDEPIHHRLSAVESLRVGEQPALGIDAPHETEPIRPVPDKHVDVVRGLVRPVVRDMIDLQLLSAMRPGEVVIMRGVDLDTDGKVWIYRPSHHKLEHHQIDRTIYLGPRCQEIIRGRLKPDVQAALFESIPGKMYTTDSYRRAITRACESAGIDNWAPNRLRHNAATTLRKSGGLDAAQAMLGHAEIRTTQVYADRLESVATSVALKHG